MIRTLLADSDLDMINNYKTYIRASFPKIKVVGTLTAPEKFMETVKELRPQLVLTDIRFFGANPIQLLKDAYDFYPQIKFVVYGTYNDYDYIKKAMEYGVVDYMYRPVKPAEFHLCMERVTAVFDNMALMDLENSKLAEDYKNNIIMFQDKFLTSLLQGHLSSESEIELSMHYFSIKLEPEYTVFVLRIDHFKKIILTLDEMEKHLLIYKTFLIVSNKLRQKSRGIAVMNRFNSVSGIIGGSEELSEILELCDEIKSEVSLQTKLSVTIGVGRAYKKLSQINISANESEAALRYRYLMGYNTVIPIHFVEPLNEITYKYPTEKEQLLIYSAVAGEYDYSSLLLKQIIQTLKDCGELPERLVPKIIMNILISISRFASEQHIDIENKFREFFDFKDIFDLKTIDEAYFYLNNALKNFCSYMIQLRDKNNAEILEAVENYIDERYYEHITLAKMARFAKTTPEFLNKIFVESEKCTLHEYVIKIRIKIAKELMKKENLEDDVIAVRVGYDDMKHFRSIFKRYEGIYPFEYKRQFMPERRDSI